jgi:hypothetical protein
MKFCAHILALAAVLPAAGAFTLKAPVSQTVALNAASDYSYLGNLNTSAPGSNPASVPRPSGVESSSIAPIGSQTPGAMARSSGRPITTQELVDSITPVTVQGGTLRTCSFSEACDRVSVLLKTNGRPLNANVELWQGPDNTPQKMSVYLEDGSLRPFRATIESPGSSNAIAIRNTGQMEFPLTAGLEVDMSGPDGGPGAILLDNSEWRTVQGGAVYTTPFPPSVQSVQVMLKSDGRPLNARLELLQGPNNNKQVMEIYSEDGRERPFYVVIDTPGSGNVVRIVNTATVEFPLSAAIESYIVDDRAFSGPGGDADMTWS